MGLLPWQRQALLPKKRQLVPVAALELDLVILDVEEPASSQAKWVTPFKDGPVSVLKEVVDDADHVCGCKAMDEHIANVLSALDWRLGNLVVDGIGRIHFCETDRVLSIEGCNPGMNKFAWCHL